MNVGVVEQRYEAVKELLAEDSASEGGLPLRPCN